MDVDTECNKNELIEQTEVQNFEIYNEQKNNSLMLDVSGVRYSLHKDFILKHKGTLLTVLFNKYLYEKNETSLPNGVYKKLSPERYFVQRSPAIFDVIFQCYVTGKLHIPSWMCREEVMEEIRFWRMSPNFACRQCCYQEDSKANEERAGVPTVDKEVMIWRKIKLSMWTFFTEPGSSWGATIFAILVMMFVFISITNLVLSSIPSLHLCPRNGTEIYDKSSVAELGEILQVDITNFNESSLAKTNLTLKFEPSGVLRFFSNCIGMQKLEIIDMLCALWFTVELSLRFVVCPNKISFIKSPVNIIDCAACFPVYIEFCLWMFDVHSAMLSYKLTLVFRFLRSITVLRILKLARYSAKLRILGKMLQAASRELTMLCLFLSVSVLIFSSLLYELENGQTDTHYYSIPASMWWSICTLTTVGFGDITPVTCFGKMVASVACVAGITLVALPVSVLVEHFTTAYKKQHEIMKLSKADFVDSSWL